ncbi:sensor histidine kinase [Algoriphagus taiwanensis]|uniref:histidine kinase n=1 Tax=Algoriphagus taiwanensis TaxID=1445656 RepID=A0ABQ6PZ30_9BACT|nr:hypothetical protein Ataiwa_14580 [Algoriphagus taiwanensis]
MSLSGIPLNSRVKSLESLSTLVFEALDMPIFILSIKEGLDFVTIYSSEKAPTELLPESIWNQKARKCNDYIHCIEDLRTLNNSLGELDHLLEVGILFCSRMKLVSNRKEHLGHLYLMDYSVREIGKNQTQLMEAIRDLSTKILEGEKEGRKFFERRDRAINLNKLVLEASKQIGLGGLCINLPKEEIYWYKSNNSILNLPDGFDLEFSEFIDESISKKHKKYPLLVSLIEQVRIGLSKLKIRFHNNYVVIENETKSYFSFSLERIGDLIYVVFYENTKLIELDSELTRIESLLLAEESIQQVAGWTLTLNNQEMAWTENVRKLLGLAPDTLPSWDIFEAKLSLCNKCLPSELELMVRGPKGKFEKVVDLVLDSGEVRHLSISASLSKNSKGEEIIFGSLRDNTQALTTENELSFLVDKHQKIKSYIDHLLFTDIFFLLRLTMEGTVKSVNNYYSKTFLGPYPQSLESYHPMSDIVEDDHLLCQQTFEKALANPGSNNRVFLRKKTFDKKEIYTQWDFKVTLNEYGQPEEILCIGIDISEIQIKRKELRELIDLVSKQNTQLIEYNSILSHNIRNHVANLKGLANLIDLSKDPKDIFQFWDLIKEAIHLLDQRIIAINHLAKQKSKHTQEKSQITLNTILANSQAFFTDELQLTNAQWYVISEPELLQLKMNSVLERVLIQLISNAIKFRSPKRELIIKIKIILKPDLLQISIQDNGIGMDLKKNKKISSDYLEFNHLEPNSKGLGIFLAKHLLESIGGELNYVSRIDCGTKAILTFFNYEKKTNPSG